MTPHGDAADLDPAIELAIAHAMVNRLRSPGPEMVRAYRPSGPTVVFGRRDTRLRGFRDAVSLAREQGFTPLVRSTGGRAVAYTNQALVIDHARHEPGGSLSQDDRFASFGPATSRRFANSAYRRSWGPFRGILSGSPYRQLSGDGQAHRDLSTDHIARVAVLQPGRAR